MKTTACTTTEAMLVLWLVNSTGRSSPGIWSTSPGDRTTNRTTPMISAATSTILPQLCWNSDHKLPPVYRNLRGRALRVCESEIVGLRGGGRWEGRQVQKAARGRRVWSRTGKACAARDGRGDVEGWGGSRWQVCLPPPPFPFSTRVSAPIANADLEP